MIADEGNGLVVAHTTSARTIDPRLLIPDYSRGVGVTFSSFSLANKHRTGWERVSGLDFVNEVNRNLGDNPALTFVSARFNASQRPSS